MPLLCFSDIVILGPCVHFCPGPSRESSWKLSAASTTPKLSPAPIGSSQPGTAGISFRFSSCQFRGKSQKKTSFFTCRSFRETWGRVKFGPLIPAEKRAVGFICPPTTHKFECENWSRGKGKQSPERWEIQEEMEQLLVFGMGTQVTLCDLRGL